MDEFIITGVIGSGVWQLSMDELIITASSAIRQIGLLEKPKRNFPEKPVRAFYGCLMLLFFAKGNSKINFWNSFDFRLLSNRYFHNFLWEKKTNFHQESENILIFQFKSSPYCL